MTKSVLRKQFIALREKLTPQEVESKSRKIFQQLVDIDQIKSTQNISAYLPIHNEVDTKLIINHLISKGKRIFLPRYLGNTPGVGNKQGYVFAEFTGWVNLESGPFGILQPIEEVLIVSGQIDVAIIPGVAFDKQGMRLGYGKGVFDRLLAKSKAFKIGLAYDFQIVGLLLREKHDLVMDLVVTESKVIL